MEDYLRTVLENKNAEVQNLKLELRKAKADKEKYKDACSRTIIKLERIQTDIQKLIEEIYNESKDL